MTRDPRHARAFTLIEVAASSLVIGMMFIAVLSLVTDARRGQLDNRDRLIAAELAGMLMGELSAMEFVDPTDADSALGTNSDESEDERRTWDDVDDAAAYKQSPPLDASDRALAVLSGVDASRWAWAVDVEFVDPADPTITRVTPTTAKRVTVTVSRGSMTLATLVAIRTQGGS